MLYSIVPVSALLLVSYVVASAVYYHTQEHLFDPYLQLGPALYEATPSEAPRAFRILALGGSTTANDALPEPQRYPTVLQDRLRHQYPSLPIEVLNAGKDWYTTKHSLINYVTYYRDWKPDLVIIMHAMNDLSRSFSPPDYAVGPYNDQWSHFYGPAIRGAKPLAFDQFLLTYVSSFTSNWYSTLRVQTVDYPIERYRSIPVFEKNLRKLVEFIHRDGADVLLVTEPFLYKESVSPQEFDRIVLDWVVFNTKTGFMSEERPTVQSLFHAGRAINEVTRTVAASEHALFLDAEQKLDKNLQNFTDDVHYTEQGARNLAEMVAQTIIHSQLIHQPSQ
jgi:lysophospholipase L1-like esterase